MPKIVDYPRSNLTRALALAEAVDRLGGEASVESAADALGNKIGGAFKSLISSAQKFNLLSLTRGRLKLEPLYQDYKLAYTDEQKREAVRKAFLSAPLYGAIVKRLEGQTVPPHFEKLLIREYDVASEFASRLALYFNEGIRDAGLIGPGGVIQNPDGGTSAVLGRPPAIMDQQETTLDPSENSDMPIAVPVANGYTVRITGPGIDSKIAIRDEEDIEIVDVTLRKVRRLLKHQQSLLPQETTEGSES